MTDFLYINLGVLGGCERFPIFVSKEWGLFLENVVKRKFPINRTKLIQYPLFSSVVQHLLAALTQQFGLELVARSTHFSTCRHIRVKVCRSQVIVDGAGDEMAAYPRLYLQAPRAFS